MTRLASLAPRRLAAVALAAACAAAAAPQAARAQECFIGEVRYFAGNFAPRNWAFAEGQLIAISQNQALFAILGTQYGGDGRTTFALPDLRGRTPVGPGRGPGLSDIRIGQQVGRETISEVPAHTHAATTTARMRAASGAAATGAPTGAALADTGREDVYAAAAPDVDMAEGSVSATTTVQATGQSAVNIRPPQLGIHPIICLFGIFPSRN
jgi:microcystin-dependent protein